MLGNDTWFMYEKGTEKKLTHDAFGGVKVFGEAYMAEGDTPAPRDTSAKSNSLNLDDIRATCEKEINCIKKKNGRPRYPLICQSRIGTCMRMRTKLSTKLIEADQSKAITGGLEVENASDAAKLPTDKASDAGSDNTMLYVGIGGGVLLLVGVAAIFLLKKPASAPVAAV